MDYPAQQLVEHDSAVILAPDFEFTALPRVNGCGVSRLDIAGFGYRRSYKIQAIRKQESAESCVASRSGDYEPRLMIMDRDDVTGKSSSR